MRKPYCVWKGVLCMINLLRKEMKLSASILSYLFIAFGLITFCPGYPILVGGFFVCLGIYQSFQNSREANDIVYSALLPVRKSDVVRSKYIFCVFIELCAFIVSAAVTLLRMTLFSDAAVYRGNALMNANPAFLGFLLLIFGCFNAIFVCGYFKTAYKFGKPFVCFTIVAILVASVGEALHFVPGLEAINAFGFEHMGLQLGVLAAGAALYALLTLLSMKRAIRHFELIDL